MHFYWIPLAILVVVSVILTPLMFTPVVVLVDSRSRGVKVRWSFSVVVREPAGRGLSQHRVVQVRRLWTWIWSGKPFRESEAISEASCPHSRVSRRFLLTTGVRSAYALALFLLKPSALQPR